MVYRELIVTGEAIEKFIKEVDKSSFLYYRIANNFVGNNFVLEVNNEETGKGSRALG
jgi:hypothetical protein